MREDVLRIGELAQRAGVSTRTVDFYTGLGLLVPARRTGGNFRLYAADDVDRIRLIRRLEVQGIRLEDIARALAPSSSASASSSDQDPAGPPSSGDVAPDSRDAVRGHLASLEEQVRALQSVADVADPRTHGLLATLTARAQALIATAVVLGAELASEIEHLPPL